ncbi:MAG TPA: cysteine--tRNA ligase [Steroidobacteraceae bacterium]|nr:cysteine--tRNA ligase [Steroidobacteraceae bacterium]
MPLVLHNTLTRRKDVFEPLDPKNVRMYVCGPTVYDFAHIGNARPVIVFDVLYRLLRQIYGVPHVRYVRNITDVDDKINAAAKANGESIRSVTERTAKAFHEDVAALGALPPDVEPRATEHVAQMIQMTERLIASGHAYAADGHVLFSVASMPDYGRLSGRTRDEMIAGARVEVAPYKRDPADFVLWKPSPDDLPGWPSPWGRGRPGWHIECSAMSEAHLGETFDIHGGGLDIIFPHHENEVAQSVSAHHGKPFVRYWVHNAMLLVDGEKMSKSLGNFRTIRDVLAQVPGETARYAMLMTHYRDPLDWTEERLAEAKHALDRFYLALRQARGVTPAVARPPARVLAALEDDLNTPLALAAMHDLLSEINKTSGTGDQARLKGELLASGAMLGLLQKDPEIWLKGDDGSAAQIDALVAERNAARKARDFAEADRIRNALAIRGILLEDGPGGTTWRRAT